MWSSVWCRLTCHPRRLEDDLVASPDMCSSIPKLVDMLENDPKCSDRNACGIFCVGDVNGDSGRDAVLSSPSHPACPPLPPLFLGRRRQSQLLWINNGIQGGPRPQATHGFARVSGGAPDVGSHRRQGCVTWEWRGRAVAVCLPRGVTQCAFVVEVVCPAARAFGDFHGVEGAAVCTLA